MRTGSVPEWPRRDGYCCPHVTQCRSASGTGCTPCNCKHPGKQYVEAHRSAFTEFADANWASALRNVSPSLLWAIRLRLQREQVAPDQDGERDALQVVAALVGEALTRAAAALPESVLKEAPVLENIGLHRPALTGVDMELFNSLAKRNRLGASIREARAKLQQENHK